MKKLKKIISKEGAVFISYLFIILFIYTASDKLWNYTDFKEFFMTLDVIHSFGQYLAWGIPALEILISLCLLFPVSRLPGLYATFGLMSLFTMYLIYMRFTAKVLPCHCGGVISELSWTQHIWFNIALILLASAGIYLELKSAKNLAIVPGQKTT